MSGTGTCSVRGTHIFLLRAGSHKEPAEVVFHAAPLTPGLTLPMHPVTTTTTELALQTCMPGAPTMLATLGSMLVAPGHRWLHCSPSPCGTVGAHSAL